MIALGSLTMALPVDSHSSSWLFSKLYVSFQVIRKSVHTGFQQATILLEEVSIMQHIVLENK